MIGRDSDGVELFAKLGELGRTFRRDEISINQPWVAWREVPVSELEAESAMTDTGGD